MTAYYTFLNADGTSRHGWRGCWLLADGSGAPGPWQPRLALPLLSGQRGYQVLGEKDLIDWLGPVLHRVEIDLEGMVVVEGDQRHLLVATARDLGRVPTWNTRTARLFVADCASRVLPLYERRYPGNNGPRRAIAAARAFARGEIDQEARQAAAAAAWEAIETATEDAEVAELELGDISAHGDVTEYRAAQANARDAAAASAAAEAAAHAAGTIARYPDWRGGYSAWDAQDYDGLADYRAAADAARSAARAAAEAARNSDKAAHWVALDAAEAAWSIADTDYYNAKTILDATEDASGAFRAAAEDAFEDARAARAEARTAVMRAAIAAKNGERESHSTARAPVGAAWDAARDAAAAARNARAVSSISSAAAESAWDAAITAAQDARAARDAAWDAAARASEVAPGTAADIADAMWRVVREGWHPGKAGAGTAKAGWEAVVAAALNAALHAAWLAMTAQDVEAAAWSAARAAGEEARAAHAAEKATERAAAHATVRAAVREAVRPTTKAAYWHAAGEAAGAAERLWQRKRLRQYLSGQVQP